MTELISAGAALAAAPFFTSYHMGQQIIKIAEGLSLEELQAQYKEKNALGQVKQAGVMSTYASYLR